MLCALHGGLGSDTDDGQTAKVGCTNGPRVVLDTCYVPYTVGWARTLMMAKRQKWVDLLKDWEERGQGEGGADNGPGA